MVPSGPSTPMEEAQPIPSSLLKSISGMLGGQGGPMPSQGAFPSLVPPQPRYNNVNLLGNVPNISSLLNQSFGNGIVNPGLPGSNVQRGSIDSGAESDPLSSVGAGTGIGFNRSPSFVPTNMMNAVSPSQVQGQQFPDQSSNQLLADQQQSHSQQLEPQNFQHPLSAPLSAQPQQFQSNHAGLGSMGQVKLESQVNNDQHLPPPPQQQQLQSVRALGPVKQEPQQLQPMKNQPHVKMEPQHAEHSILLHQQQQQQQQQQLLQMSRQSSQAAAVSQLNLLQQHRFLQLQQQQQQQQHQLLKAIPQQRSQMQNMPMRSPVKPLYEVGACARRLTQFMHQQQNRPEDNNIEFWRKFVGGFFAPTSKKKWCVSMYGSGRQTTGVFPQDVWHCEICNCKPGRGFVATFEVLPRLFKIKYESGTLEELLYVDMPSEYHNPSGQIVLDYAKAIQESVFEQLHVVRDGQLRIVFSQDLKICSWEFCARHHEELIPRKLLIPQVSQLGTAAQKYQASTQNASSNSSFSDLQSNSNVLLSCAKQLVKCSDAPLVNDLGYAKRYVRCLQISEVVNTMKDLIDYSRITKTGPMESLAKFPLRANTSSSFQAQNHPSEDQQQQHMIQNSNNVQTSTSQATDMQLVPTNGVPSVNNSLNPPIPSPTVSTITGCQNPMVSRPRNPMNCTSSNPCAQTSLFSPPSQSNPSPSQIPTPTTLSKNSPANVSMQQQQQSPRLSNGDPTDSQSSAQQIIQEMMLICRENGPSGVGVSALGNDTKNINVSDILPSNMTNSNPSFGFSDMGQVAMLNGARTAMGSNPIAMNGRVGMASVGGDQGVGFHRQQDLSHQLLSGFGSVNGFNNLQFDWKSS